MGKESVGNFYKADVRFLKEVVGRESEFEKPYLDEDYRKMHFDFPLPDWPPFPDPLPWPEIPPGPEPGLSLCGITCYIPGGGDCTEPIWCHPSIWCGTDMSCNLCSWTVTGATTGYTWKHIVDGVPSKTRGIEIWIDENLLTEGKALIHAQMRDPCGNLCGEDLEVTCKVCPPDIVISWDSDLNLTVGQGNGGFATAAVKVKDGLGPYTWSVAGTGFSMQDAVTNGVNNVLQADATACGLATVTVTDFCGDSVTGYVRCTAGQWTEIGFTSCVVSGDPDTPGGAVRTEGKYRLTENIRSAFAAGLPDNTYNGFANCTEGYNMCVRDGANCDKGAPCHADMGCTKCLTNSWCATNYTLCHNAATCKCCALTSSGCVCNNPGGTCYYSTMCIEDTSKLEEWTCVP